jgi:hypothetical protein
MNVRAFLHAIPRPAIPVRGPLFFRKAVVMTWYPSALYRRPLSVVNYLLFDRETTNFTYEIANRDDLGRFVDHLFGRGTAKYVWELEADTALRARLQEQTAIQSPITADGQAGTRRFVL